MTERTARIAEKMIIYDCGDIRRIEHFIKVHGYASAIGRLEGLNSRELETLEIAALLHDIGIKISEEKYHSSAGKYQELEGPAQARKLPKEGDSVLILGANGKSGVLCGWEAMKKVGPNGKVVGVVRNPKQVPGLLELGVYTDVIVADCTKPVEVMEAALAANDGKEYDLSICCVNIESCEMSAILPVHDDGLVYFFSMATSFTKAALGAEGIGKDVTMIIGNGYTKNHAQITLDVLRENPKLRKLFDEKYC